MFAHERQDRIFEMINKNGAVVTSELVSIFKVSIETIRRDLLTMEQDGRLLRVHGGAVAKSGVMPFYSLDERMEQCDNGKRNLAEKAAELVENGDIIGIDSGSTAMAFAEILKIRFTNLTIITHSMDVFNILSPNFDVILCGGIYMQKENAFYGPLTIDMLKHLHITKVFICPTAISLEYGIFDYQHELYQIQKAMMNISERTVILADSSKFEKTALLKIDDMKNDYDYVTDFNISEKLIELYRKNDIKIHIGKEQL